MTQRKVVAAYQERGSDGRNYPVSVTDDGQHWLYDGAQRTWCKISLPLPPEALGEVEGDNAEIAEEVRRGGEPTTVGDLGEWPGTADVPPNTIRDVEIMTPHGACLAWYSSKDGWRAYATTRDCDPLIATRDVLRWRDLPCAVVEGGRVTGVARG